LLQVTFLFGAEPFFAGLSTYYDSPIFNDISILCSDGVVIRVHQVVLAACSGRLAEVLARGWFVRCCMPVRGRSAAAGTPMHGGACTALAACKPLCAGSARWRPTGQAAGRQLPVQGVDPVALRAVLASFYGQPLVINLATVLPLLDVASKLQVWTGSDHRPDGIAPLAEPPRHLTRSPSSPPDPTRSMSLLWLIGSPRSPNLLRAPCRVTAAQVPSLIDACERFVASQLHLRPAHAAPALLEGAMHYRLITVLEASLETCRSRYGGAGWQALRG
jgi:hypothetical protein